MAKTKLTQYLFWIGCAVAGVLVGTGAIYWHENNSITPTPQLTQTVEPITTVSPVASPISQPVRLIFTGDVMLGRSVNKNIVEHADPAWPFIYVADRLRSADITYINLEGPLVASCPVVDTGMVFCGSTDNVAGLVSAGVDIASLANNHATNYGSDGLSSTITTLSANGISPVGVGAPVKLTRHGQNFTFLSFNDIGPYPGIDNVDETTLPVTIQNAKVAGQTLIVTFHWGHEYQANPSQRQVRLAHAAIDAGADLVVGAHPHWVQTHELYQGKPIYYSLGNFIFDQEWSAETKRGLVVEFSYLNGELLKTEEFSVLIENYGQPHFQ